MLNLKRMTNIDSIHDVVPNDIYDVLTSASHKTVWSTISALKAYCPKASPLPGITLFTMDIKKICNLCGA